MPAGGSVRATVVYRSRLPPVSFYRYGFRFSTLSTRRSERRRTQAPRPASAPADRHRPAAARRRDDEIHKANNLDTQDWEDSMGRQQDRRTCMQYRAQDAQPIVG